MAKNRRNVEQNLIGGTPAQKGGAKRGISNSTGWSYNRRPRLKDKKATPNNQGVLPVTYQPEQPSFEILPIIQSTLDSASKSISNDQAERALSNLDNKVNYTTGGIRQFAANQLGIGDDGRTLESQSALEKIVKPFDTQAFTVSLRDSIIKTLENSPEGIVNPYTGAPYTPDELTGEILETIGDTEGGLSSIQDSNKAFEKWYEKKYNEKMPIEQLNQIRFAYNDVAYPYEDIDNQEVRDATLNFYGTTDRESIKAKLLPDAVRTTATGFKNIDISAQNAIEKINALPPVIKATVGQSLPYRLVQDISRTSFYEGSALLLDKEDAVDYTKRVMGDVGLDITYSPVKKIKTKTFAEASAKISQLQPESWQKVVEAQEAINNKLKSFNDSPEGKKIQEEFEATDQAVNYKRLKENYQAIITNLDAIASDNVDYFNVLETMSVLGGTDEGKKALEHSTNIQALRKVAEESVGTEKEQEANENLTLAHTAALNDGSILILNKLEELSERLKSLSNPKIEEYFSIMSPRDGQPSRYSQIEQELKLAQDEYNALGQDFIKNHPESKEFYKQISELKEKRKEAIASSTISKLYEYVISSEGLDENQEKVSSYETTNALEEGYNVFEDEKALQYFFENVSAEDIEAFSMSEYNDKVYSVYSSFGIVPEIRAEDFMDKLPSLVDLLISNSYTNASPEAKTAALVEHVIANFAAYMPDADENTTPDEVRAFAAQWVQNMSDNGFIYPSVFQLNVQADIEAGLKNVENAHKKYANAELDLRYGKRDFRSADELMKDVVNSQVAYRILKHQQDNVSAGLYTSFRFKLATMGMGIKFAMMKDATSFIPFLADKERAETQAAINNVLNKTAVGDILTESEQLIYDALIMENLNQQEVAKNAYFDAGRFGFPSFVNYAFALAATWTPANWLARGVIQGVGGLWSAAKTSKSLSNFGKTITNLGKGSGRASETAVILETPVQKAIRLVTASTLQSQVGGYWMAQAEAESYKAPTYELYKGIDGLWGIDAKLSENDPDLARIFGAGKAFTEISITENLSFLLERMNPYIKSFFNTTLRIGLTPALNHKYTKILFSMMQKTAVGKGLMRIGASRFYKGAFTRGTGKYFEQISNMPYEIMEEQFALIGDAIQKKLFGVSNPEFSHNPLGALADVTQQTALVFSVPVIGKLLIGGGGSFVKGAMEHLYTEQNLSLIGFDMSKVGSMSQVLFWTNPVLRARNKEWKLAESIANDLLSIKTRQEWVNSVLPSLILGNSHVGGNNKSQLKSKMLIQWLSKIQEIGNEYFRDSNVALRNTMSFKQYHDLIVAERGDIVNAIAPMFDPKLSPTSEQISIAKDILEDIKINAKTEFAKEDADTALRAFENYQAKDDRYKSITSFREHYFINSSKIAFIEEQLYLFEQRNMPINTHKLMDLMLDLDLGETDSRNLNTRILDAQYKIANNPSVYGSSISTIGREYPVTMNSWVARPNKEEWERIRLEGFGLFENELGNLVVQKNGLGEELTEQQAVGRIVSAINSNTATYYDMLAVSANLDKIAISNESKQIIYKALQNNFEGIVSGINNDLNRGFVLKNLILLEHASRALAIRNSSSDLTTLILDKMRADENGWQSGIGKYYANPDMAMRLRRLLNTLQMFDTVIDGKLIQEEYSKIFDKDGGMAQLPRDDEAFEDDESVGNSAVTNHLIDKADKTTDQAGKTWTTVDADGNLKTLKTIKEEIKSFFQEYLDMSARQSAQYAELIVRMAKSLHKLGIHDTLEGAIASMPQYRFIEKARKIGKSINKDMLYSLLTNEETVGQNKDSYYDLVNGIKKAYEGVIDFLDAKEAHKELVKRGYNDAYIAMQDGQAVAIHGKDGKVYGFATKDGKIYIDHNNLDYSKPIHETGHVWFSAVSRAANNGDEKAKAVIEKFHSIISDTEIGRRYLDRIKNSNISLYQRLDDAGKIEEAIITLIGDYGAEIAQNFDKAELENSIFFQAIKSLYEWLKETIKGFAGLSAKEISQMTFNEFMNASLKDIVTNEVFVSGVVSNLENNVANKEKEINWSIAYTDIFKDKSLDSSQHIAIRNLAMKMEDVLKELGIDKLGDKRPFEKELVELFRQTGIFINNSGKLVIEISDKDSKINPKVQGFLKGEAYDQNTHGGVLIPESEINEDLFGVSLPANSPFYVEYRLEDIFTHDSLYKLYDKFDIRNLKVLVVSSENNEYFAHGKSAEGLYHKDDKEEFIVINTHKPVTAVSSDTRRTILHEITHWSQQLYKDRVDPNFQIDESAFIEKDRAKRILQNSLMMNRFGAVVLKPEKKKEIRDEMDKFRKDPSNLKIAEKLANYDMLNAWLRHLNDYSDTVKMAEDFYTVLYLLNEDADKDYKRSPVEQEAIFVEDRADYTPEKARLITPYLWNKKSFLDRAIVSETAGVGMDEMMFSVEGEILEGYSTPISKALSISNFANIKEDFWNGKLGDLKSAQAFAERIVSQKFADNLVNQYGEFSPVLVYPTKGKESQNFIPQALSQDLSQKTGFESLSLIENESLSKSKDAKGLNKLTFKREYKGEIESGRNYIIVDDVLTTGNTVQSMRDFIESKGGKVIIVAVSATSRSGSNIDSTPEQVKSINKLYSKDIELIETLFGKKVDKLSFQQAKYLIKIGSPAALRAEIGQESEYSDGYFISVDKGLDVSYPSTKLVGDKSLTLRNEPIRNSLIETLKKSNTFIDAFAGGGIVSNFAATFSDTPVVQNYFGDKFFIFERIAQRDQEEFQSLVNKLYDQILNVKNDKNNKEPHNKIKEIVLSFEDKDVAWFVASHTNFRNNEIDNIESLKKQYTPLPQSVNNNQKELINKSVETIFKNKDKIKLEHKDGWQLLKDAKEGDFIYLDPPYLFVTRYSSGVNAKINDERIQDLVDAKNRGVKIMYFDSASLELSNKLKEAGFEVSAVAYRNSKVAHLMATANVEGSHHTKLDVEDVMFSIEEDNMETRDILFNTTTNEVPAGLDFDISDDNENKTNLFMLDTDKRPVGSYNIKDNLVTFFKSADRHTIVHEYSHWWLQALIKASEEGNMNATRMIVALNNSWLQEVEKYLAAKKKIDDQLAKGKSADDIKVNFNKAVAEIYHTYAGFPQKQLSEFFARGAESYFNQGKLVYYTDQQNGNKRRSEFKHKYKSLFASFRTFMLDLFKSLSYNPELIDIPISDVNSEIYLRMINIDPNRYTLETFADRDFPEIEKNLTRETIDALIEELKSGRIYDDEMTESLEFLRSIIFLYKKKEIDTKVKTYSPVSRSELLKLINTPRWSNIDKYVTELDFIDNFVNDVNFRRDMLRLKETREKALRRASRNAADYPEFYQVILEAGKISTSALKTKEDISSLLWILESRPTSHSIEDMRTALAELQYVQKEHNTTKAFAQKTVVKRKELLTEMAQAMSENGASDIDILRETGMVKNEDGGWSASKDSILAQLMVEADSIDDFFDMKDMIADATYYAQREDIANFRTFVANKSDIRDDLAMQFLDIDLDELVDERLMEYREMLVELSNSGKVTPKIANFVIDFKSQMYDAYIKNVASAKYVEALRQSSNRTTVKRYFGSNNLPMGLRKTPDGNYELSLGNISMWNLPQIIDFIDGMTDNYQGEVSKIITQPLEEAMIKHRKAMYKILSRMENLRKKIDTVGQLHEAGLYWLLSQMPNVQLKITNKQGETLPSDHRDRELIEEFGFTESELDLLYSNPTISAAEFYEMTPFGYSLIPGVSVDNPRFKVFEELRKRKLESIAADIIYSYGENPADYIEGYEQFKEGVDKRGDERYENVKNSNYVQDMMDAKKEMLKNTGFENMAELVVAILNGGYRPSNQGILDYVSEAQKIFDEIYDGKFSGGENMGYISQMYSGEEFVRIHNYAPILTYMSDTMKRDKAEAQSSLTLEQIAGETPMPDFTVTRGRININSDFAKNRTENKKLNLIEVNGAEIVKKGADPEVFYMTHEPQRRLLYEMFTLKGGFFHTSDEKTKSKLIKSDEESPVQSLDEKTATYIKKLMASYFLRHITPAKLAIRQSEGLKRTMGLVNTARSLALSGSYQAFGQVTASMISGGELAVELGISPSDYTQELMRSIHEFGNNPDQITDFLVQNAPEIAFRGLSDFDLESEAVYNITLKQMFNGELFNSYYQRAEKGFWGNLMQKYMKAIANNGSKDFQKNILLPMIYFDRLAARTTFIAAYNLYLKSSGKTVDYTIADQDAIDFALRVVRNSQNSDTDIWKPGVSVGIHPTEPGEKTYAESSGFDEAMRQSFWAFKSFSINEQQNLRRKILRYAELTNDDSVPMSEKAEELKNLAIHIAWVVAGRSMFEMTKSAFKYAFFGVPLITMYMGRWMEMLTTGGDEPSETPDWDETITGAPLLQDGYYIGFEGAKNRYDVSYLLQQKKDFEKTSYRSRLGYIFNKLDGEFLAAKAVRDMIGINSGLDYAFGMFMTMMRAYKEGRYAGEEGERFTMSKGWSEGTYYDETDLLGFGIPFLLDAADTTFETFSGMASGETGTSPGTAATMLNMASWIKSALGKSANISPVNVPFLRHPDIIKILQYIDKNVKNNQKQLRGEPIIQKIEGEYDNYIPPND